MLRPVAQQSTAVNLSPFLLPIVGASAAMFAAGGVAPAGLLSLGLTGAGAGLLGLAAIVAGLGFLEKRARQGRFTAIADFVDRDASPTFATDAEGSVVYQNKASRERFGDGQERKWHSSSNGETHHRTDRLY